MAASTPLFQSTLPRVERPFDRLADGLPSDISIHAPASGATPRNPWYSLHNYFNPRSREWSDGTDGPERKRTAISIHAPASGATDICMRTLFCQIFQSTLPRVERHDSGALVYTEKISIHAPASGATVYSRRRASKSHISIHAPASGATKS